MYYKNFNDNNNQEFLGFWEIFGLPVTWKSKIFLFVKDRLKGLSIERFWKFASVDNLHREYMALLRQGNKPVEFAVGSIKEIDKAVWDTQAWKVILKLQNKTGLPQRIIDLFCRALFFGSHSGAFPYAKWNPGGYEESQELRQQWESERGLIQRTLEAGKTPAKILLTFGIVAGAGFILYNISNIQKVKRG